MFVASTVLVNLVLVGERAGRPDHVTWIFNNPRICKNMLLGFRSPEISHVVQRFYCRSAAIIGPPSTYVSTVFPRK
jgi:hypothetical protein